MKIAFIVSTFPPSFGGIGDIVFEEAVRLTKKGHEVAVFCLKYKGVNYEKDKELPFKVFRLKSLKFGDAGFAPQLFFKLKGFDFVHLHFPFYGIYQCILLLNFFKKQKYFLTYHMDAQSSGFKKFLQNLYDFLFTKKLISKAEKIFIVDKNIIENSKYLKKINSSKIELLVNGVDFEIFSPWPKELQLDKLEKTMLFVGNAMPIKRLDLLIKVLLRFKEKNIRLVIVGGGYAIKKYKNLAKELKVIEKISFEGYVDDKRLLANYYNLADITIVPSDYESFSLSALSAVMCGCPVVVSNKTAFKKEVAEHSLGDIFEVGNVDDLFEKINNVLNKNYRIDSKKINYLREKYSWEKHIEDLLKFYNN